MIKKLLPLFLLFNGCSEPLYLDFSIDKFIESKVEYDSYIIQRENGLHRLKGTTVSDSSYGIIAVHGYYPKSWPTKGFEWIQPLKQLTELEIPVWFLKYDWENCPDSSAFFLSEQIEYLFDNFSHLDSILVIGHSLGGMVSTLFAEEYTPSKPTTVHSIAAPLAGINRSFSFCKQFIKNEYVISSSVNYTQWRTSHQSDGAFRNLAIDPQIVTITNGHIVDLPTEWNNGRLGHNRSIQYETTQIVGKN